MLRIVSAAVLVGLLSGAASAQTVIIVPSDPPAEFVPWDSAVTPQQNAPVLPGTNTVPGRYYPTPAQKRLDTPSVGGGGG